MTTGTYSCKNENEKQNRNRALCTENQLALYDPYRYIHLINLSTTIRNRLDNEYDSDSVLLYCRCTEHSPCNEHVN
jgi:hypothetical protein